MPLFPFRRNSDLRQTASVHDLPEVGRQAEESGELTRQTSNPPPKVAEEPQPKRKSTLLGGGLRPLTQNSSSRPPSRNEKTPEPRKDAPGSTGNLATQRSKSTADMSTLHLRQMQQNETETQSEEQRFGQGNGMRRRLTTDDERANDTWARNRQMRQREGELSSSFRSHGW